MNDRDRITKRDTDNMLVFNGETFIGGFQALLELLNDNSPIAISEPIGIGSINPPGSYYRIGTITILNRSYSFVAFSVCKEKFVYGQGFIYYYPTVLTIWNTEVLGAFKNFYGNDIGLHLQYSYDDPTSFHAGRNFSCVRTAKGANLINLHCPNDKANIALKLPTVLSEFMSEAKAQFGSWRTNATVIGGDFNDAKDYLQKIRFNDEVYEYEGYAPRSCCLEFDYDTIDKPYRLPGDKLYATKYRPSTIADPLGQYNRIILFEPPEGVNLKYGGVKRFHNLSKKISKGKSKTKTNATRHLSRHTNKSYY